MYVDDLIIIIIRLLDDDNLEVVYVYNQDRIFVDFRSSNIGMWE